MDVLPEYLFTGTDTDKAASLFSRAIDLEALGFHAEARGLRYNAQRILDHGNVRESPWSMPAPVDTEVEDYTSSVRPAFLDRTGRRERLWSWALNGALFACVVVSLYLFLYFAAPLVRG